MSGHVDLDLDLVSIDAVDGSGEDFGKHAAGVKRRRVAERARGAKGETRARMVAARRASTESAERRRPSRRPACYWPGTR